MKKSDLAVAIGSCVVKTVGGFARVGGGKGFHIVLRGGLLPMKHRHNDSHL